VPHFGIRLGQIGVAIGELGHDVRRQSRFRWHVAHRCLAERFLALVRPAQFTEHQAPVNVGLDVPRVEPQRLLEVPQCQLRSPQQRLAQAQQVLDGNNKIPHDLLVPYLAFTQDDFEAALPNIAQGSVASHEYTQADAVAAIKANMK